MSTLVIVESPTKAKTISKFLGKDYTVESSFGHVRDLPKSKMGIDIEGGTFEPTYVTSKDKATKISALKAAAKKSDDIIFATDEDREGEAIAWHLAHILKIDPKKAKRIVFHEITKHAIDQALEKPRTIDQSLVDAQQARRVLDRLVGYELSPLLWKKVARGLSAGRVQSVAVRLIVDRERERQAFVPQEYWTIDGLFAKADHEFEAALHKIKEKKLKKFDIGNETQATEITKALDGADYTVSSIQQKDAKRKPLAPFRTSTLQQKANNTIGFSSKQTMRVAQQLYEGIDLGGEQVGLITYMRTDSVNLSEKFLNEAHSYIHNSFGKEYGIDTPRAFKSKAKGAQEAHEAIRPTDPARSPDSIKQYLTDQQYKLYNLIWNRAIASQMAVARMKRTAIELTAKDYTFRATGQVVVFDGWLKLYPESVKHDTLPELKEGEAVDCKRITPNKHVTEPPARYSDATLVKAMEELGIGRPSTYSPTIGTIEARNYVERDDNKKLAPTDIAFVVNDLLVSHFSSIVDYDFTATMENSLDDIAEKDKQWQPLIAEFYHPFHEAIQKKTEELTKEETVGMRDLGTDPETKKPVYARVGRYGAFVQLGSKDDEEKPKFASLQKGQSVETITLEEALHLLTLPRVVGKTEDDQDIIVNIGRYGPYVQVQKTYYSIKEDDPYTISLERAKEIIKEGKEREAKKTIKEFTDSDIKVLNGRYGPYITDGKKNARIPKDKEPSELTLTECARLIEEAPTKRRARRKTNKKEIMT